MDAVVTTTTVQTVTVVKETTVVEAYSDSLELTESDPVTEPYTISFWYDGAFRVVANPTIDSDKRLLGGVELERNGVKTNHFKQFSLSKIG